MNTNPISVGKFSPRAAYRAWNMPGDPLTVIGSMKLEF